MDFVHFIELVQFETKNFVPFYYLIIFTQLFSLCDFRSR